MENVNEGNRRFIKYNGPVYDDVEVIIPDISVHPLDSEILTESNRPQTDKQKMKEIKLAAIETSKSLTRLLELLRSYDV